MRLVNRFGLVLLVLLFVAGCATHGMRLPEVPAPRGSTAEEINGYLVADPYRDLENAAQAEAWVEAQNARTRAYLEKVKVDGVAERIAELFAIGFVGDPFMAGGKVFYLKLEPGQEQRKLFVRENGGDRLLVDPESVDASGKTALDWFRPSKTGGFVAYGLSKGGDENSTLYVVDVATGKRLPDTLPDTRHASIGWLPDDSGFYFTTYPGGAQYDRHVYFHRLGEKADAATYVFGRGRKKTDWPSVGVDRDGRYLMMSVGTGVTTSDSYLVDIATNRVITVAENLDAEVWPAAVVGDKVWLYTTLDAPNMRFVEADIDDPSPENWRDILPERDVPLKGVERVGKDRLVALYLETAVSHLRLFDLAGHELGEIELPAPGSVSGMSGEPGSERIVIEYSSFLYPQSLFVIEPARSMKAEPMIKTSAGGAFNPEDFTVEYVEYPSYDGTKVPMFLVYRKDMVRDGGNPTVLYGYGGFSISMGPSFSRTNLFWIERGGVYALAAIRGGGEKGEAWHKAGMEEKKFQVFKDFEYAMRYLIREDYTRPEKLAIRGGSNGGLLVGAMITGVPHLFAAAVGQVGLYDMVRYHKFPPAQLWIPEYGSADVPEQTGYLWAYSPYHQVLPGVRYPASFIHTAESDTRVHWLHSAKFAAALQAAGPSRGPILFELQRQAGHGQGMNWSDVMKKTADTYYFLLDQIGDPAAAR
ncbi:MAG: prolyl oligopeptidase family serine peptidase [Candidatus Lernaella stagnicola]|nr:prolyl oligopeptidase family serine peptidase [Candidatus Lernaella stagnicola]